MYKSAEHSEGFWEFIKPKTFLLVLIDGTVETHNRNRNNNAESTEIFLISVKLSAFPVTKELVYYQQSLTDEVTHIIDSYKEFNLSEIFLRPVNYQGFARKKYNETSKAANEWLSSYQSTKLHLENNGNSETKIREINSPYI